MPAGLRRSGHGLLSVRVGFEAGHGAVQRLSHSAERKLKAERRRSGTVSAHSTQLPFPSEGGPSSRSWPGPATASLSGRSRHLRFRYTLAREIWGSGSESGTPSHRQADSADTGPVMVAHLGGGG